MNRARRAGPRVALTFSPVTRFCLLSFIKPVIYTPLTTPQSIDEDAFRHRKTCQEEAVAITKKKKKNSFNVKIYLSFNSPAIVFKVLRFV